MEVKNNLGSLRDSESQETLQRVVFYVADPDQF